MSQISVARAVHAVLSQPEADLDYASAKLAFDRLIDPTIEEDAVHQQLARLGEEVRRLAGDDRGALAFTAAMRPRGSHFDAQLVHRRSKHSMLDRSWRIATCRALSARN